MQGTALLRVGAAVALAAGVFLAFASRATVLRAEQTRTTESQTGKIETETLPFLFNAALRARRQLSCVPGRATHRGAPHSRILSLVASIGTARQRSLVHQAGQHACADVGAQAEQTAAPGHGAGGDRARLEFMRSRCSRCSREAMFRRSARRRSVASIASFLCRRFRRRLGVAFRMCREHGARCVSDQTLGDTAEQHVRKAAASVRAHDDQVHLLFARELLDDLAAPPMRASIVTANRVRSSALNVPSRRSLAARSDLSCISGVAGT